MRLRVLVVEGAVATVAEALYKITLTMSELPPAAHWTSSSRNRLLQYCSGQYVQTSCSSLEKSTTILLLWNDWFKSQIACCGQEGPVIICWSLQR